MTTARDNVTQVDQEDPGANVASLIEVTNVLERHDPNRIGPNNPTPSRSPAPQTSEEGDETNA